MKDGGICGGVEGNIREWVKVFGREAKNASLPLSFSQKVSEV